MGKMLEGKVALVTGASRGIGKAIALRFAAEGAAIAFTHVTPGAAAEQTEQEIAALGVKVKRYVADAADYVATEAIVADVVKEFGRVDILVNNAGVSLIKLFTDTTDEDYYNIMNTNLGGTFFVTREVARNMISNHFGRIVNIGSMWGKVGASCEVVYSASKAAIEGFTKALAKELGPSGVTVNCIEPGVINTEMNAELDEETLKSLCDETPVGKIGDADELADFIFEIATEKSGFLTGQIIGFDGGFAI